MLTIPQNIIIIIISSILLKLWSLFFSYYILFASEMQELTQLTSQIIVSIINILEVLLRLIRYHTGLFWVMFFRMVYSCQSPVLSFYFSLSRSSWKQEYAQIISSCFYYTFLIISLCSGLWGGVGTSCGDGIGDILVL